MFVSVALLTFSPKEKRTKFWLLSESEDQGISKKIALESESADNFCEGETMWKGFY